MSFKVNQENGTLFQDCAVVGTNVNTRLQSAANRSRSVAQRRIWMKM